MTPEEVAKVRELLTHEDPDIQRQGLELAKSFGDYSAVFEGCSIDDEGKIQLSFGGLLNDSIFEGLRETTRITDDDISRMQARANLSSAYLADIRRVVVPKPDNIENGSTWATIAELINDNEGERASKLLEECLSGAYLDENRYRADYCGHEEAISNHLGLVCGFDFDDLEVGEIETNLVTVTDCGYRDGDIYLNATAYFLFPNWIGQLIETVEMVGGDFDFDNGFAIYGDVDDETHTSWWTPRAYEGEPHDLVWMIVAGYLQMKGTEPVAERSTEAFTEQRLSFEDIGLDPLSIEELDLAFKVSLEHIDDLAGFTNLRSLDLSWCNSLENVDGLSRLINLKSLDLGGCQLLQNLDGLAGLTNLTSLDLSWCEALTIPPDQPKMTTREEVAAYQAKLRGK